MREPIAIVGIGCRFPGATGPDGYWELLTGGVDAIREIPPDRWPVDSFYDENPRIPGRMNTRWGGFLDDIDEFDANFFGISQREAERMDPQQRLALEVSYEALFDAGIPSARLAERSVGVYVGASTFDHGAALQAGGAMPQIYDGTGSALSVIANRISYCLNLRGPSLTVDTACSSSLVAIHLAAQALSRGDAEIALAGGVNVITSPGIAIIFSQGGLMAPDGRCKTFDSRADGYVRSEGAGFVVMKPLERAIADGDRIYATVLGGATNHDGRTNGLTAPSRIAQQALLRAAYRDCGVDPAAVDYIEAHGTGTAVGDPIEVGALAAVLGSGRTPDTAVRVGSCKTNLGHLEAAAGIAGFVKTALALHHRLLPPTIHFQQANPLLGLDRVPVVVQAEQERWPRSDAAALAGVSSFGFGGTNAHVVLSESEAPGRDAAAPAYPVLIPLSAVDDDRLTGTLAEWATSASDDPGRLSSAAAAAAVRADHHRRRVAVVAEDPEQFSVSLAALARSEPDTRVLGPADRAARPPRMAFVFPGQGPQWPGMGRRLAAAVPEFRDAIRRCDAVVADLTGRPLWSDEEGLIVGGTERVQPALFAFQVALARTWVAWGIRPAAVIGHSMGEVAAAHVSGALSLEDAARVACARSELAAEISGRGGLALVELNADEVADLIRGREDVLSLAALNGPRATVVSGTAEAIGELVAELESRRLFVRRIAVEFAAHSPEVEPLQPRLAAAVSGIRGLRAGIPFYSTVFGEPAAGTELGPDYWARNLREPVLFAPTAQRLLDDGHRGLIEISPHPVLAHALADIVAAGGHDAVQVPTLRRDADEMVGLLRGVGAAYTAGAPVNWSALYGERVPHVPLPRHRWAPQRLPAVRAVDAHGSPGAVRPSAADGLLGPRIPIGVDPSLHVWPLPLTAANNPELLEHVVDEQPIVPAAYWLTAAQHAADGLRSGPVGLRDVEFAAPYCLVDGGGAPLQVSIRTTADGDRRVDIVTLPSTGNPVGHCAATVDDAIDVEPGGPAGAPEFDLDAARRRCTRPASIVELYDGLAELGLHYGPAFRGLTEMTLGDGEALARFAGPDASGAQLTPIHPALLDSCLHTIAATASSDIPGSLPLPVRVRRVRWKRPPRPVTAGWCHARIREVRGRELSADVLVTDESGESLWHAGDFTVRFVTAATEPEQGRLYRVAWSSRPIAEPTATGAWLVIGDRVAAQRVCRRLAGCGVGTLAAVDLESDSDAPPHRGAPLAGNDSVAAIARRLTGPADYRRMLEEAERTAGPLRGVLDLRATASGPKAPNLDTLSSTAQRALDLAGAMNDWSDGTRTPVLWLVTADTQGVGSDTDAATLSGAVLWGLARTLAFEMPGIATGSVDLCSRGGTDPWPVDDRDVDALVGLVRGSDGANQAIIRDGAISVPSLSRIAGALTQPDMSLDPERTYLITGGLGVLGRHVAGRLIDRGARHLVLVSRNATASALDDLRGEGVDVRVAAVDVAVADEVDTLIAGIQGSPHPLAGVFHAAGVLADALLPDLGAAELRAALAGKAVGAWHLHQATRDVPLDHFVLFSSAAGLIGSPGQAAYAAANTFLDAVAMHRAGAGLPALTMIWGTWAGAGLAAVGAQRIERLGMPSLHPRAGLDLLEAAIATSNPAVLAAGFDPAALQRNSSILPAGARMLLDSVIAGAGEAARLERGSLRDEVLRHESDSAVRAALERVLIRLVAQTLGASPDQIDPNVPFQEAGLDSLTAIELRDRLEAGFDTELSAALFFAHPTVHAFAGELHSRLRGAVRPSTSATPPSSSTGSAEPVDDLGELSDLGDDELTSLLSDEIQALRELREER